MLWEMQEGWAGEEQRAVGGGTEERDWRNGAKES